MKDNSVKYVCSFSQIWSIQNAFIWLYAKDVRQNYQMNVQSVDQSEESIKKYTNLDFKLIIFLFLSKTYFCLVIWWFYKNSNTF